MSQPPLSRISSLARLGRLATVAAVAAAATLTPACDSSPSHYERWQRSKAPGLVVLVVIDQFPQWAFEQKLPELTAGGFRRLLSEGQWQVGEYPSAATLTAPGHSLLGSGETSAQSGILSNEWWHRDSGRVLKSVEAENGAVSTKWMRVPGLGDAIAASGTTAKAVAVSMKERAAILPLGHHGTAIWYSAKTVDWLSNAAPPWLAQWNREKPISLHLHHVWEPLDADRLRRVTGRRDGQPGEVGDSGLTATFPHQLDQSKSPANALLATPLGNQLLLETAQAAIVGENLGFDADRDLLVISFSSYDYVAHAWGHESWESWDTAIRLDRQLADLLASLDRLVGKGRWAMLVTSDHGGSPLPELAGGGRMQFEQVEQVANKAATTVLGEGDWIADPKSPTLFLSEAARAQPPEKLAAAIDAILVALRAAPAIARAERTSDFAGNCEARSGDDHAICIALDADRSGEIFYVPKRGWILEELKEPMATSHGTLYDYDRQVPVLTLPFGRTPHAPLTAPAGGPRLSMREVSKILATWLGVTPPAQMPR
jgi:Type I phosphodiesterase / nucleotide pyrophosphatase